MKKLLITGIVLLFFGFVQSQDYNIGIRAGLNYSKFLGPLETGETNSFSGGFHFGLSYAYNFTDLFAINSGLFYIQNGNKQHYEGDSYYIIRLADGNKIYEEGKSIIDLDVSNAYISIPITANFFIGEKFEVFAGVYANFLISPIGGGQWEFDSADRPDDISFIQSMDHNYYSDKALGAQSYGEPIVIWVDDKEYLLPNVGGAYYFYDEKDGNKYNVFDFGLTGGVSYYINSGLFFGVRASYGLTDTTNDKMDVSLRSLADDKRFIYTNDKDNHFGMEFSIGFRF